MCQGKFTFMEVLLFVVVAPPGLLDPMQYTRHFVQLPCRVCKPTTVS